MESKVRYAMFTKSSKQTSGFSVMNAEELFSVNGGDTYPATNYGDGLMIVDNTGTHDTIYTGPGSDDPGHCLPMNGIPAVQGTYDTETGTFTPNNSSSSNNTSSGSASGNSQSSGPSGGSSSGGSSSGGK